MVKVSKAKSMNKYLESKIVQTIEQKAMFDDLSNESTFLGHPESKQMDKR